MVVNLLPRLCGGDLACYLQVTCHLAWAKSLEVSACLLAGSVGREAASNRLMGRESHGLFREQAHDFVGLKALVNQVDYQRAKDLIDLPINPVSVRTGRATVLGADFGSVAHSDSPGAKIRK